MRMSMFRRMGPLAALVVGLALLIGWAGAALAAPNLQFTATPAPVSLPTISPTAAEVITSTPTRTPTPPGPALAEALEGATNVRAEPDIEGTLLGQIYPGEQYPVLGRAEGTLWVKIQYPDAPTGTAWVFEQVIQLSGNVDLIPDITISTEPTIDANQVGATQTIEGLALTPGALATTTADAIIFGAALNGTPLPPAETAGPLPTYTYPATSAGVATPGVSRTITSESESGMPPIVPIVALAALGSFGLLVSLLRRG